jgi:hypothetical protein
MTWSVDFNNNGGPMSEKIRTRVVIATCKCEHFNIEIEASIEAHSILTSSELLHLERTLKWKLAYAISKLPFANVFANEVGTKTRVQNN